eukprot:m.468612 g.468612  ORF g.468612 m.468612 type:complete len:52 (+) comp296125_c0_seq1:50-205(+)
MHVQSAGWYLLAIDRCNTSCTGTVTVVVIVSQRCRGLGAPCPTSRTLLFWH